MRQEIEKYPRASIEFVQEEHKNMGAWSYVKPRIETVLKKMKDGREVGWVYSFFYAKINWEKNVKESNKGIKPVEQNVEESLATAQGD